MKNDPSCDCGHDDQIVKHIQNDCPKRKFYGGIEGIMNLTTKALDWLKNLNIQLWHM